jgi:uncharacterized protein involved in type VI secretion and phage assembly
MKPFSAVGTAVVVDNIDPENSGRVKVRVAQAGAAAKDGAEAWARVATLMAGRNRGTWFMPDPGDEVLVAFDAGDVGRPYVIGALWSGSDAPPTTMDGNNDRKLLRSRNGVTVTLSDQAGRESFVVTTPGGQRVLLKDGSGAIEITDSNGNAVTLESGGVTVTSAGKITLNASLVEIGASMLTVNAGMAKFSGVVQCDTLISNSVISASYTPGAGNVW